MEKFLNNYAVTDKADPTPWGAPSRLASPSIDFLRNYAGTTFSNGVYRLHNRETGRYSQENAELAFPDIKDFILVFGFDWRGKQYSFDLGNPNQILQLDVAEGNYYSVDVDFKKFHEKVLIKHKEETLNIDIYTKWQAYINSTSLLHTECIGFNIPLFLNGMDDFSNMEKTDLDVYWSINAMLLRSVK